MRQFDASPERMGKVAKRYGFSEVAALDPMLASDALETAFASGYGPEFTRILFGPVRGGRKILEVAGMYAGSPLEREIYAAIGAELDCTGSLENACRIAEALGCWLPAAALDNGNGIVIIDAAYYTKDMGSVEAVADALLLDWNGRSAEARDAIREIAPRCEDDPEALAGVARSLALPDSRRLVGNGNPGAVRMLAEIAYEMRDCPYSRRKVIGILSSLDGDALGRGLESVAAAARRYVDPREVTAAARRLQVR